jgi:hypothetical protein
VLTESIQNGIRVNEFRVRGIEVLKNFFIAYVTDNFLSGMYVNDSSHDRRRRFSHPLPPATPRREKRTSQVGDSALR